MSRLFYVALQNVGLVHCIRYSCVVYSYIVCSSITFTHYSKCFHSSDRHYIETVFGANIYLFLIVCVCVRLSALK